MVLECLECNLKCGTHFTSVFHYKIEHKNKTSECVFGDELLSGICRGGIVSKISGTVSKCSSSSSNPNLNSISNPSSNSSSNYNPSSNPSSSSNSSLNPSSNSIPRSRSSFSSSSNYTYSFTNTKIKFDITNKICNK